MEQRLEVIPVGPLQMNAVLLTARKGDVAEAILIDPGEEAERLFGRIDDLGCRVVALLATHGHFDHVGAASRVQGRYDLPLRCHADDVPIIETMPEIQQAYGFPPTSVPRLAADLQDGEQITWAGDPLVVSHVPGHSPGQVMFRWRDYAIVGDCLFAGSVGRTDLYGGDFATLEKSIRERIYTLPDETVVVCGHGPDTTVGREKSSNPFVRG